MITLGGEPIGHMKLLDIGIASGGSSITLTVPDDVRWIIKYGYAKRTTAAVLAGYIYMSDGSTLIHNFLSAASGTTDVNFGAGDNCEDTFQDWYPEIPAGCVVKFVWAAGS